MKGEYIMKTHIISGIASIFGGENNDYKSLYHKYVERPADEVNRGSNTFRLANSRR